MKTRFATRTIIDAGSVRVNMTTLLNVWGILMKTTANIESIDLWKNNPGQYNATEIVRVNFKFPCEWTTFTIDELLQILRLWIQTEERRYPPEQGYKGRWMLFEEINKLFHEVKK